jgi:hypothetical protein
MLHLETFWATGMGVQKWNKIDDQQDPHEEPLDDDLLQGDQHTPTIAGDTRRRHIFLFYLD